jgi:hypothetical protein
MSNTGTGSGSYQNKSEALLEDMAERVKTNQRTSAQIACFCIPVYLSLLLIAIGLALAELIFGVVSIVLSTREWTCDHIDPSLRMDMRHMMLGSGIAMLLSCVIDLYCNVSVKIREKNKFSGQNSFTNTNVRYINALLGVFYGIWTILWGIVLFSSNVECLNSSEYYGTYAVVVFVVCFCLFVKYLRSLANSE